MKQRGTVLYEKYNKHGALLERWYRKGNELIRESDIYPEIRFKILTKEESKKTKDEICQNLTRHPKAHVS